MSQVLGVRFSGPLESYAEGFAAELGRLGYKPTGGIKPQLFLIAHLSRWLAAGGLAPSELVSPVVVEEFFAVRRAAGYTNHRTVKEVLSSVVDEVLRESQAAYSSVGIDSSRVGAHPLSKGPRPQGPSPLCTASCVLRPAGSTRRRETSADTPEDRG